MNNLFNKLIDKLYDSKLLIMLGEYVNRHRIDGENFKKNYEKVKKADKEN